MVLKMDFHASVGDREILVVKVFSPETVEDPFLLGLGIVSFMITARNTVVKELEKQGHEVHLQ